MAQHYMLPTTPLFNRVALYLLARYAAKHHVKLAAFVLMSTHSHVMLADAGRGRKAFERDFHAALARAANWFNGRMGRVWDSGPPHEKYLKTEESIRHTVVYVATNPVKDGAVALSTSWPGLHSTPRMWREKTKVVKRPVCGFFGKFTIYPREVIFKLHAPALPGGAPATGAALDALVTSTELAIATEEVRLRQIRTAAGKGFVGKARIRKKRWTEMARTLRKYIPPVSISPGLARALAEASSALRAWQATYKAARDAFIEGKRDVLFPYGTWALWDRYRVNVAAP